MRNCLIATFVLSFQLVLAGCHEPEPNFLTSVLRFDERLAGTWRMELPAEDEATVTVTIAPRTLEVADGRVKPEQLDGSARTSEGQDPMWSPNAFVGLIVGDSVGDDGKREHVEIEIKGFMLGIDGEQFLTFQPSAKQMNIAHLGGLVLPIHQVVKVRCDGDVATVWAPRVEIGWLPNVTWLDAPKEPLPPEPDLGDLASGPRRVTMDADRFVAVLRKYAKVEDFWVEPTTLKRVN